MTKPIGTTIKLSVFFGLFCLLAVTAMAQPTITTQPANATACVGAPASFTVVASGTGTLHYQWHLGVANVGTDSATYSIAVAALTDAGSYTVDVTDDTGTTPSAAATLTVNALPSVSVTPAAPTICQGAIVTLTASSDAATPSYLWSPGGETTASIDVTPGSTTTYTCTVTDAATGCANSGSATVTVQALITAVDVTSPAVCIGGTASFTATVTGTGPFTYIWKDPNGNTIGSSATLNVVNAQLSSAGDYTVEVAGPCNNFTNSGSLTVNEPIVVSDFTPASATVCQGATVTFTVTVASGTSPIYTWYKGATLLAGVVGNTLTIPNATIASNGTYKVVVSNGGCASVTNSGVLTVNVPVAVSSISTWPNGTTNCAGGMIILTANIQGLVSSYVWKKDGVVLEGQMGQTLTIDPFTTAEVGVYSVEVSGDCGSATNSTALYVVPAPVITTQPASQNKVQGDPVTFSVVGTSITNSPTTYQWRFNGSPISGATSASYTVASAGFANIGSYDCVLANCAGTVTSSAATLSLAPVTAIWLDFDTPGQLTNNFNTRFNATLTPAGNALVWRELPTGGITNSGALDNGRATGDDSTLNYHRSSFNFSAQGTVLRAQVMFKAKAPSNNNRTMQLGFMNHTNVPNSTYYNTSLSYTNCSINDNAGQQFMSYFLYSKAQPALTFDLGGEYKGATNASSRWQQPYSPDQTLIAGNWYRFTVCFTNNKAGTLGGITTANSILGGALLEDCGNDGLAVPTTVYAYNSTYTNAELVNMNRMTLGLRSLENAGCDFIDNLAVWMNDGPLAVTYPPMSQTILQGRSVTFTASVDGTPPYYFQWMKDGSDIPGATQPTYSIAAVSPGDAAGYSVRVYNDTSTATSDAAILTVTPDNTPPALVSAGSLNGSKVGVKFDELLDPVSAVDPANYTVSGSTVSSVTLRPHVLIAGGPAIGSQTQDAVELTLSSSVSGTFTVTVNGVQDLAGNAVSSATVSGSVAGWTGTDMAGTDWVAPLTPGSTYTANAGDFDVIAGGADLWNQADDGHVVVGPAKTGDFDVKVRLQNLTRYHLYDTNTSRDDFLKAALIARESIHPQSKSIQAVVFPTDLGAPAGRDYIEYSWRNLTWGNMAALPIANNSADNFRGSPTFPNAWLRLRRVGSWFTYYVSSNNVDWISKASANDVSGQFPSTLLICLGVSAHYNAANYPVYAEFRDFSEVTYPGATLSAVTLTPATASLADYASQTFTATPTITGASPSDVYYVWQRSDGAGNWTNIPNSFPYTNTYTTPPIQPSDAAGLGSWQFRCIAYLSGQPPVTSTVGQITAETDTAGPTISSASYSSAGGMGVITVTFSEPVDIDRATALGNWTLTNSSGQAIALSGVSYYGDSLANGYVVVQPSVQLGNANNYGIVAANMLDRWSPQNLTVSTFKLFNVAGTLITNSTGYSTSYPAPQSENDKVTIERYIAVSTANGNLDQLTNHTKYLYGQPDAVFYSNVFNLSSDFANQYGCRLSTYFIPPTNGFYRFYCRGDDANSLLLNTNELASAEPLAKTIAFTSAYGSVYTVNGGANPANIYLVGGRSYYLEGNFKDNTGGEGIWVTSRSQRDDVTPGASEILPTTFLAPHPVLNGPVRIGDIVPSTLTVNEGDYAVFRVTNVVGWRPMTASWWKNGVWQPGKDEGAAQIGPFRLGDTAVTCLISNRFSVAAISAAITVLPDNTAPTVISARGDGTLFRVYVDFSEDLDPETANNPANYTISDGVNTLPVYKANLVQNRTVILNTDTQDQGVSYTVAINGVKDISVAGNAASTTAAFTSWIVGPSMAWREYWTNSQGGNFLAGATNSGGIGNTYNTSISTLTNNPTFIVHDPDLQDVNTLFEVASWPVAQPTSSNWYSGVVSGFFIPPLSGNYVFQMKHDDGGQFLLFTDPPSTSNPDGTTIGMVNDYSVRNTWVDIINDSMTNALQAGKRYYMEARFKQGTGGNYVQLGVRFPNDVPGVAITASVGNGYIAAAGDPTSPVLPTLTITQQPLDSPDTIENQSATFFLTASNSKNWAMGYQWQKYDNASGKWLDVVGAAASSVSIPVTLADDGAQFRAKIGVPGRVIYSNPVSVHVLPDNGCPTVVSASGDVLSNVVVITFSERVSPATANNIANYTFSGGVPVIDAVLQPNGKSVALTLGANIESGSYTVTVRDITDIAASPNVMCLNPTTTAPFSAPWPMAFGYIQVQVYANLQTVPGSWQNSNYLMSVVTGSPKYPSMADYTIYTNTADFTSTNFLSPGGQMDNYATRMLGIIIPPVSGNYSFLANADDSSQMMLSSLGDPNYGQMIIKADGVGCAACNPPFNGGNHPAAYSPPISLVAGQPYSFEALGLEAAGGDFLHLWWKVPGATYYTNIFSTNLAFSVNPDTVTLTTVKHPASQAILEGRATTFTAQGGASVGIPGYQWQQSTDAGATWVDIPGAVGTSFSTGYMCEPDSGTQYRCVIGISLVNGLITRTNITDVATLTVLPDNDPPYIVSAGSLDGNSIGVVFSEPVRVNDPEFPYIKQYDYWRILDTNISQLLATNIYTGVPGCNPETDPDCAYTYFDYPVTEVIAWPDPNALYSDKLVLKLGGHFTPSVQGPFSVNCGYAVDTACRKNANNTTADSVTMGLTGVSISFTNNQLGSYFASASNRVTVTAAGYDMWNAGDELYYVTKPVSGDFDARVTVVGLPDPAGPIPSDSGGWSKAGLMFRGYITGTDGLVTNNTFGTATNSYMAYMVATSTNTAAMGVAGVNVFAGGIRYSNLAGATDLGSGTRQSITGVYPTNAFPVQLRMVREGANMTVFYWGYGTNFTTNLDLTVNTNLTQAWVSTGATASGLNWNDDGWIGLGTTAHSQPSGTNQVTATYQDFYLVERPTITLQPEPIVVTTSGVPITITVAGTGPAEGNPLRYQWYKDDVKIVGATSSTLTLTNPGAADRGNYSADVRNSAGPVRSEAALLEVRILPYIITQPLSQTIQCNGSATFTVAVTPDAEEPLTYQWQLGGVDLAGQTDSSLAVDNVTLATAGPYTVVVSNPVGNVTSAPANLLLSDGVMPVITCPANINVECGSPVTFTATATANSCGFVWPVVCLPPSGSAFAVGVTTVNCVAEDALSATNTCSFTVTVTDTLLPVISGCPVNQSATTTSNSAVVTWTAPTALDACSGARPVVCTPSSGSDFVIGTTPVDCVAVDAQGNTAHCTFNVVVSGPQGDITLTYTLSGGDFSVSWPKPATGYVLEWATIVAPIASADWAAYTGTINDNGTTFSVTVPASGTKFFRLHKP